MKTILERIKAFPFSDFLWDTAQILTIYFCAGLGMYSSLEMIQPKFGALAGWIGYAICFLALLWNVQLRSRHYNLRLNFKQLYSTAVQSHELAQQYKMMCERMQKIIEETERKAWEANHDVSRGDKKPN